LGDKLRKKSLLVYNRFAGEVMGKIYILGSVGSGKTTFAKRLSKELNVSYYELDNLVWEYHPDGDIRRSEEESERLFLEILNHENWIIENVGRSFFDKGFEEADTIIYLNISKRVLYKRVLLRWIKQNLRIEKAPYKTDIKMLMQMFAWVDKELNNSKLNKLHPYKEKLEVLNEKQVKRYKYNSGGRKK